jgi:hypothetical protein
MRIRCYTLFDITRTGVVNRKAPLNGSPEKTLEWERNRNTQCNLDTIIQIISLRSQPENISSPIKINEKFKDFGFMYEDEEINYHWEFEFDILRQSVFDDGINPIGYLISDCDNVPMLLVGTEWPKLINFLDITPELRNIYFEVISNENE